MMTPVMLSSGAASIAYRRRRGRRLNPKPTSPNCSTYPGAQSGMTALNDIVGLLATASDPVDVLRRLVLEDGGDWPPALESDGRHLVEIQYCGVTGFGFDTGAATRNWLENARRDMEDHDWLARIRRIHAQSMFREGVSSIL